MNSVSPLFEDKDGVQDDVHNAAKGKADARLFGFAHSPHQMAQDQPGHRGQTADDKHPKEIPGRKAEGQLIGLEKGKDGFHEQPQDNGQNGRHAKAGPETKGRGFFGGVLIVFSQASGDHAVGADAEQIGHSGEQGENGKGDGKRRKLVGVADLSHKEGVRQTV